LSYNYIQIRPNMEIITVCSDRKMLFDMIIVCIKDSDF
jgi:hypothetical protein